MKKARRAGFTLIELLTVVAIIAILAGMIMVVGPRMIEKAKITRMKSAMKQLETSLLSYLADHRGYPAAYGYVAGATTADPPTDTTLDEKYYNLTPYLAVLKEHGNAAYDDEFSDSYDTDRDNHLSLLEFLPYGKNTPTGRVLDKQLPRYNGSNNAAEVSRQMEAKARPFVYVTVNKAQFARVQKAWIEAGDFLASTWPPAGSTNIATMTFPPTKYDAFVLISVGPGNDTFGLLDLPSGVNPTDKNAYYINALRAYFLATRDMNGNDLRDFDFEARTQQKEAAAEYTVDTKSGSKPCNNDLPSARAPKGAGPMIWVSQ